MKNINSFIKSHCGFGGISSVSRQYFVLLTALLTLGAGNAWAQDTISVVETGDDSGLLKIILAIIAAVVGCGVVLTIHYTKNVKKNKVSNRTETGGAFSPATSNTQQGNGNTIDSSVNKDAVINIHLGSEIKNKKAEVPTDFEQDRQTIEVLISLLDIQILEEFLFGGNQNRLNNRLFDMRDAWYAKYYPIEPVFNDTETQRVMKAFYEEFDKLIRKCANYYDPEDGTDKYSKIRGLICDSFDDRIEDQEHFEEVIAQIKNVEPVYKAMKDLAIRKYKLNF